ncbi:MAG: XTP/dITP diphosphatase [Candidatus Thermoplasmatota archaeon]|nr:XTP/dITP diphosphatase [Candidatus Thermoplasmatota archaeon]MBS3790334.1 XTP/dITP diphosphatase [Candidatus Thermoplasmatota archaeon]
MIKETLTIITSNQGKYKEYREKLGGHYKQVEMADVGYPEIQAEELKEVVEFALEVLSERSPLIIDDSGLFVDSLNGFPGVYSSYVMKTLGCDGILSLMENRKDRGSRFECVIGYLGERKKIFKGISRGTITQEKKGTGGFGYDPIFQPEESEKTYAEMSSNEKNRISHRGRAMEKLLDFVASK